MKKSLFALAAVTAFAGAAQAQSSVTVYGILDLGYVGGNERLASGSVTKQNLSTFGQSAQSTSRLGFRGTEDLGGGMSAFFNLEIQLNPMTSNVIGGTRAANVGLAQKGVGNVAVGTLNTVVTDAMSPTITGQFNNIAGSMLFPGNTAVSTNNSNSYLNKSSADGNTDAFTFRTSNTLKLQTERMAGIQIGGMVVMNNETDTVGTSPANSGSGYTGGKNDQNGWGLGANYQWKKLVVTAAYQSFRANNPNGANTYTYNTSSGGTTTSTTGGVAAFGAVNTGTNVQDNQAYVGAAYDFGILKAYAGWVNRKVTSQLSSNQYAKRTAQEIGVRGNWTPKIESWASAGNGRLNTFGASAPTANLVGWQVGTNYILSKRTNLYAIYGQDSTSNVSINNANPISYTANNYAVGIRHSF